MSAAFSPIMIDGALVLPDVSVGMIEASATRRPAMPCLSRPSGAADDRRRQEYALSAPRLDDCFGSTWVDQSGREGRPLSRRCAPLRITKAKRGAGWRAAVPDFPGM